MTTCRKLVARIFFRRLLPAACVFFEFWLVHVIIYVFRDGLLSSQLNNDHQLWLGRTCFPTLHNYLLQTCFMYLLKISIGSPDYLCFPFVFYSAPQSSLILTRSHVFFPAFIAGYIYGLWILISSLDYLCLPWLATRLNNTRILSLGNYVVVVVVWKLSIL